METEPTKPQQTQNDYTSIFQKHSKESEYVVRELASEDYDKGFYELLDQLAKSPKLPREEFEERLQAIRKESSTYKIIVFEDVNTNKLIASGAILIEKKFILGNAIAGHLEDIVVETTLRKKGIGKILVEALTELGSHLGCYRITLHCREHLMPFYEKNSYKSGGPMMNQFFQHNKKV